MTSSIPAASAAAASTTAKKRSIYEVLGVEVDADDETVKRAYHVLALKFHPDRNKQDIASELKFKEILEAYEVIRNPEKRIMHDRESKSVTNSDLTEAKLSRSPSALFEAVDNFFSKSGTGVSPAMQDLLSSYKRKTKGRTLRVTVQTSFQESVFGCLKLAEISKVSFCSICKDMGILIDLPTVTSNISNNPFFEGDSKKMCGSCKGTGRMYINKGLEVEIPPGARRGEERLYEGEGDVGDNGAPPGDLIIVFDTQEHPYFKRDGDDVLVDISVSFAQASLGAALSIQSIYGNLDVNVPPGTQPNDVLRISDQGFYNLRTKKRGNMLLKLIINIPRILTEQQRILLQQFILTEGCGGV